MGTYSDDVAVYGYALALLLHAGLAVYLLATGRLAAEGRRAAALFIAALTATAAWSGFSLAAEIYRPAAWPWLASAADLARYALWFAFLLPLARTSGGPGASPARLLQATALGATALAAVLLVLNGPEGMAGGTAGLATAAGLALPVCGLLMVEQLFRNAGEGSRWSAKPVCLGLACVFAFDIYLYAEALLFGRFDPDARSVRAAVHTLAVPLLLVAARRQTDWLQRLQVSRTAAFYSATLILAGGYLLFMSALGYYVRFFGGTWGGALQLGLLVLGLAFLAALALSGSLRSWLRVFVGKHFYSYRYDYREEWLRFTAMLSSNRSPQETGEMIVRGLAAMVECNGGSLWTREGEAGAFTQAAHWNMPRVEDAEPADSTLCTFLQERGWVIDLEEFRSSPRRYEGLTLPTWVLASPSAWLVVPLLVGDGLLGFVVLVRPRTAVELNWEVLDLLKTAGRQAAGYLAQMQATEALLEARKFEAFNRMSAFVVHDLKNIVTQLSLMLKNAERLHDNREFQQDMLLTVESSLEKMKRLMLQLREGATPPGGSRGVELEPIVRRLQDMARARGRTLEVDRIEKLATRGHEDRLERVLGHLVQNAFDATPEQGRVWVHVERLSGQVKVDVGDTGAGMTEEFVQKQLFRPFSSTKQSGMGIGSYESFQYIRELGGNLSVASRVGQGTVVTVQLPLFEAGQGPDVLRAGAA